tara:strand:- start:1104 stop:1439 length:336 start_codon:yes stop_codon:yes gene_type:complete
MKKLDKTFTSNGFEFKQIHREDMYSIYERKYIDSKSNHHYEAIRIQSHNGMEIAGNKIPPSEYYPSSNSWGRHGYTCLTKKDAYNKLDVMMKEEVVNKEAANKKAERKSAK